MTPIRTTAAPDTGFALPDAADPAAASDSAAFRDKATAAAEKFEGFFIGQMLKQMRSASREFAPEGSVFKDPVNSDMLDLADRLMADQMAGQHAFGIADAILRQLLPPAGSASDAALNAAPAPVASPK